MYIDHWFFFPTDESENIINYTRPHVQNIYVTTSVLPLGYNTINFSRNTCIDTNNNYFKS